MFNIKRHPSERLFVSGNDCIIIPLPFKPYTAEAKFIDHEPIKHPGCNPVFKDVVVASVVELGKGHHHHHKHGIQICWKTSGTREVEWRVTELTS
jgi:hypothetical protein